MDIRNYLERIRFSGELETIARIIKQPAVMLTYWRYLLKTWIFTWVEQSNWRRSTCLKRLLPTSEGDFVMSLNGLFAWMLRGLGFQVDLLSAEVFEDGVLSPEFDHLALRVKLEEDWLVDVGFDDSFVRPLILFEQGEQTQDGIAYEIEQISNYRVLSRQDDDGNWEPYYRFTMEPRKLQEFVGRCRYHQNLILHRNEFARG